MILVYNKLNKKNIHNLINQTKTTKKKINCLKEGHKNEVIKTIFQIITKKINKSCIYNYK